MHMIERLGFRSTPVVEWYSGRTMIRYYRQPRPSGGPRVACYVFDGSAWTLANRRRVI
jgi:hypothetical protein